MTKAELIAALAALPDDAKILLCSWPEDVDVRGPGVGDLFAISRVFIHEKDGPGFEPFASLDAEIEFVDSEAEMELMAADSDWAFHYDLWKAIASMGIGDVA